MLQEERQHSPHITEKFEPEDCSSSLMPSKQLFAKPSKHGSIRGHESIEYVSAERIWSIETLVSPERNPRQGNGLPNATSARQTCGPRLRKVVL